MTSADNWARVNDLFHRALELPAEERQAFLTSVCGDNAALSTVAPSKTSATVLADVTSDRIPSSSAFDFTPFASS